MNLDYFESYFLLNRLFNSNSNIIWPVFLLILILFVHKIIWEVSIKCIIKRDHIHKRILNSTNIVYMIRSKPRFPFLFILNITGNFYFWSIPDPNIQIYVFHNKSSRKAGSLNRFSFEINRVTVYLFTVPINIVSYDPYFGPLIQGWNKRLWLYGI